MADTYKLKYTAEDIDKILERADKEPLVLYYDKGASLYRGFSSKENRDLWISDPVVNAKLELFNFVAPAPFSINITAKNNKVQTILSGSTGNYIEFSFETVDEKGNVKSESVDVTFMFDDGHGNTQSITQTYNSSEDVKFNVDRYLRTGKNIVTVLVEGRLTGSYNSDDWKFTVVSLNLSSTFNVALPRETGKLIAVPYKISGPDNTISTIDFIIDGDVENAVQRTVTRSSEESRQELQNNLIPGKHTLQMRASVSIEEETFYSDTLYFEFVVKGSNKTFINISQTFNKTLPIINEDRTNFKIYAERFVMSKIPWGFVSESIDYADITWKLDDEIITIASTYNSSEQTNYAPDPIKIIPTNPGDFKLRAFYGDELLEEYDIKVIGNTSGVEEYTEFLKLKLTGLGRNNGEANPDSWSYKHPITSEVITTSFSGFAFSANQGWSNDALQISGGAQAVIHYSPLATEHAAHTNGATFEIEFEVQNVNNPDAVLVNITDGSEVGIKITGDKATITSTQGKSLSTRFVPGERIKLAFIICDNKPDTDPNDGELKPERMLYIMNNGVYERGLQYSTTDTFNVDSEIILGDPNGEATIRVYTIRCYETALTKDAEFKHYIIDSGNIAEKILANDILEGEKVSVSKMSDIIPTILFTGDINSLLAAKDKETQRYIDVEFINPNDKSKNFTIKHSRMKLQGTSSLGYPRKNFKMYSGSKWGATMYDFEGNVLADGNYAFADGDVPVHTWTLKADFSDSSCTHNASVARIFGDIEPNVIVNNERVLMTPPQKVAAEYKNYSGVDFPYQIRTTPNALAMVAFYRQSEADDYIFMGQYTLLNDKGNDEVYGFKSIYNNGLDPYYLNGDEKDKTKRIWDNGRTHCFEILDNTNIYSTFSSTDKFFDTYQDVQGIVHQNWESAFESRYPELEDEDDLATRRETATSLYNFIEWIKTTDPHKPVEPKEPEMPLEGSENYEEKLEQYYKDLEEYPGLLAQYELDYQAYEERLPECKRKFEAECTEHLDLYKCAAYYVYLIRFGAVDQVQKNMMWTTFDDKIWFPIRYDNDTILGLANTGNIAYDYTITRQTPDPASSNGSTYCYAGHDSWLWNVLESSTTFMNTVRIVDGALYEAGLDYKNVCHYFDDLASDQWCERIYNDNQEYKYIQPLLESGNNWMQFMQGKRKSHRHWWLKNRFNLCDALYVTGEYVNKSIRFIAAGTPSGSKMYFKAATDTNFGWGINKVPKENNVEAGKGETFIFNTDKVGRELAKGDPIYIFNATNIEEADFHEIAQYFSSTIDISGAYDNELGTNLKVLKIGVPEELMARGIYNRADPDDFGFSGFDNATRLEYLDIRGLSTITSFPTLKMTSLKTFLAKGSGLTSFECAEGINFTKLELPGTIQELTLSKCGWNELELPFTSLNNITLQGMGSKPEVQKFFFEWANYLLSNPDTNWANKHVYIDSIDWIGVDVDVLLELKRNLGDRLELHGKINVKSTQDSSGQLSEEQVTNIQSLFGDKIFDKNLSPILYITAPNSIYIYTDGGRTEILEGESLRFNVTIFSTDGNVSGSVNYVNNTGGTHNAKFNTETPGVLETTETGTEDEVLEIIVAFSNDDATITQHKTTYITVKKRIYAESLQIDGPEQLSAQNTFYCTPNPEEELLTGLYESKVWSFSGDISRVLTEISQDKDKFVVNCNLKEVEEELSGYITMTYTTKAGDTISESKFISVRNENVVMTKTTNPYLLNIFYKHGLCKNPNVMYKSDCALIFDSQLCKGTKQTDSIFYGEANVDKITSFDEFKHFVGIRNINPFTFSALGALKSITLPDNVETIKDGVFYSCGALENVTISSTSQLTTIGQAAFYGTAKLTELNLPITIKSISDDAFYNSGVKSLGNRSSRVVSGCAWKENDRLKFVLPAYDGDFTIPEDIVGIEDGCFSLCSNLRTLTITNPRILPPSENFGLCSAIILGDYAVGTFGWKLGNKLLGVLPGVKDKNLTIPEDAGITSIGEKAITNGIYYYPSRYASVGEWKLQRYSRTVTNLVSLIIPGTVKTLDPYAIYNNSNLGAITLREGIVSLGDYSLCQNNSLQSISIPKTVTYIGRQCLYDCSSLNSITIAVGTEELVLGEYCFSRTKIGSFTVPNSVTSLPRGTFNGCVLLSSINIHNHIQSIGGNCFSECELLNNVVLPSSITRIESSTFSGCKSLSTITIPETITYFGSDCFYGCTSLVTVRMPETVEALESRAFYGCTSLENINIPSGITLLSDNIFYGCTGLIEIVIPSGITELGQSCFNGCSSLLTVDMPDSVIHIGNYCFSGCEVLQNLNIDNVTALGKGAFSGSGLHDVDLKTNITSIPEELFKDCVQLVSVELNDNTSEILKSAFEGCRSLNNINLPENLKTLGASAFKNCMALDNIVLSSSVASIGNECFSGCSNIKTIITSSYVPATLGTNVWGSNDTNWTGGSADEKYLLVVSGSANKYQQITGWNNLLSSTKNGFELIAGYSKTNDIILYPGKSVLFAGDDPIEFIVKDVQWNNKDAEFELFYNDILCQHTEDYYWIGGTESSPGAKLTKTGELSIDSLDAEFDVVIKCTVDDSVINKNMTLTTGSLSYAEAKKVITKTSNPRAMKVCYSEGWAKSSDYIFEYECKEIADLGTAFSETSIGSGEDKLVTFNELKYFTNLIGLSAGAFKSCTALTEITLPNGIKYLGNNAFNGCTGITSITIPDSVVEIQDNCFQNCINLMEVNLPEGLKSIGEYCFSGCKKLEVINLPSSLERIGRYAFQNCSTIESITIPGGVEVLSEYAFSGCSNLMSVVLSEGLKTIGSHCFASCTNLTSINVVSTLERLEDYIFQNDYNNLKDTVLEFSDTLEYVGNSCFRNCGLKRVSLPGVKYLGSSCFASNYYIEEIELSNEITSLIECFSGCSALKSVNIPTGLISLGQRTFYGCSSLTEINLPDTLTSIGYECFYGCSSIGELHLSDRVNYIGYKAFQNCSSLRELEIPDNITKLDWQTFFGCRGLEKLVLPSGLNYFGYDCFTGCTNLTDLYLKGEDKLDVAPNVLGAFEIRSADINIDEENILESITTKDSSDMVSFTMDEGTSAADTWVFDEFGDFVPANNIDATPRTCTTNIEFDLADSCYLSFVWTALLQQTDNLLIYLDGDSERPVVKYNSDNFIANSNNSDISCVLPLTAGHHKLSLSYRRANTSGARTVKLSEITLAKDMTWRYITNSVATGQDSLKIMHVISGQDYTDTTKLFGLLAVCCNFTIISDDDWYEINNGMLLTTYPIRKVKRSNLESGETVDLDVSMVSSNSVFKYELYNGSTLCPGGIILGEDGPDVILNTTTGVLSVTDKPNPGYTITVKAINILEEGYVFSKTFTVSAYNDSPYITSESNPKLLNICKSQGWCKKDPDVMYISDCRAVSDIGTVFSGKDIDSFVEFEEFLGVSSIPERAFNNCTSLTEIVLPKNITTIKNYAFSGCSGLSGEIIIPENTTSLGTSVFNGCSGLDSVELPEKLLSIGADCFAGCSNLHDITSYSRIAPSTQTRAFGNSSTIAGNGYSGEKYLNVSTTSYGYDKNVWKDLIDTGGFILNKTNLEF